MSIWSATKARRVYAALLRIGRSLKRQVGSHRKMQRAGWSNFTFCFHDSEEVGSAVLARIGKEAGCGLTISDISLECRSGHLI